ncbi:MULTISPECIES: O-antigen ligase family protein [Burkholderiaceae]|uniref:O-antigen ligase family protein n=1 Tax=Burkholderiaceae TaxID=119060 RepID=UPI001420F48D|nr:MULTISPECIES: O-antigen ligase family protein [Burkholderiaceae]MBN3846177.1 O-antigen ligase family protein [Paraburkholderia sp. Ac-20342]NIF55419.1 O-antigen ligase family protein [Burkholderia sp. Ax-1724]NIF77818.1 O-antigen ligase family protein [Paraburkholderia sp. Cy-641]
MIFAPSLVCLTTALLFFAPAVNLMWRGGTGYCFFVIVALALGAAVVNRRMPGYFSALRTYRWFTVGMLALVVAIGAQQLVLGYWLPRQFDALSRFVLALPVFLLLRQLPSRNLRMIGWGCAAGALAVGLWAFLDQPPGGWTDANRLNNSYTNAIPFGDTALLLGFLSVFTLGWDNPRDWRMLLPRLAALVGGGYASYLSGTRGGWLAVPVFVVLLGIQYRWFAQKKRLVIVTLAIVLAAGALLSTGRIHKRLAEVPNDVSMMHKGDDDTATGLRLQLWNASRMIFERHPLYGIGKGHLVDELGAMAKRGQVKAEIVNERAHSDFFSTLAEMGAIGVIALLLFYHGMAVYFWRHRHMADPVIRAASYTGLAVATSTVIFGLTIDVLVPIMVTVLLALLVATLLAMIDARKRELAEVARTTTGARPG